MAEGENKPKLSFKELKEQFNVKRDELEGNLGKEAQRRKAWEEQNRKDKGRDKWKK